MDLLTIIATIWRHKIATIPVILITVIGAAYVIVVKPPTYTSNAEILLVNPPSPPTTAQIAADPALAKVNASNPYLTYGNLVQVADVVIDVANSPAAGQVLQGEGVATKFSVALENSFQNPPVIQVSGTGSNSAVAISVAALVAKEVINALRQIQAEQHVNPAYMITGEEFIAPTVATTSSSSKLRTLIGFAALGLIMMLIAVSISQTLEERKNTRKRRKQPISDNPVAGLPMADTPVADNSAPGTWYSDPGPATREPQTRPPHDSCPRRAPADSHPRNNR